MLKQYLRANQGGFRPRRSTTTHTLALGRLIGELKSNNLKALIVFIDFKNAFDSVHHEKILQKEG